MYTINDDVYITYSRSRSRLRGEIEIKKMTYPHTKYILNNYKYLLFKIVPEIPIILWRIKMWLLNYMCIMQFQF